MKTLLPVGESVSGFNAFTHPALTSFDTLPDSAYVPVGVVCTLFSCSSATVWRRVRDGKLIAPHRIGKRTTRWKVGELRVALAHADKEGVQ
jgi:predicted DNA-binding transcriptional regulator AlpA